MKDKVTRQCPQTTTFSKRKESRSGIEPRSFRLPAKRLTARPNRLTWQLWAWTCIYIGPWLWSQLGAGIAQWLERRTRDWKVAGSNPCWNGGRIFFSRVDFLCWLLFRYPFHPRVTTVARKKSRSFCQKCRWQVTAKHAYTLRMWLLLNRASALVTTCQMTSEDIKHQLIWSQLGKKPRRQSSAEGNTHTPNRIAFRHLPWRKDVWGILRAVCDTRSCPHYRTYPPPTTLPLPPPPLLHRHVRLSTLTRTHWHPPSTHKRTKRESWVVSKQSSQRNTENTSGVKKIPWTLNNGKLLHPPPPPPALPPLTPQKERIERERKRERTTA